VILLQNIYPAVFLDLFSNLKSQTSKYGSPGDHSFLIPAE